MKKKVPPRSEREYLRRTMNSMSSMGRFGDWMSFLQMDHPEVAAKVYKMMADDTQRRLESGRYNNNADLKKLATAEITAFMDHAKSLWPGVASWTGRKEAAAR